MFLSLQCLEDKITAISENRTEVALYYDFVFVHLRDPRHHEHPISLLNSSSSHSLKPLIPMLIFSFSFVSFMPSSIFE